MCVNTSSPFRTRLATKVSIKKEILTGKVCSQLSHYASAINAGLIVVGRFGSNRDGPTPMGSTPSALARIASTNLLVVDIQQEPPAGEPAASTSESTKIKEMPVIVEAPQPRTMDQPSIEAELVVLKKAKKLAPAFHEHIVRARIVGQEVETGSRFMVFDIVETSPHGKVSVTPRTKLEFVR